MSMISAQCDELRNAADELQDIIDNGHNYTWHGIFTILHYAQQALCRAAVTIWELRNKLAGTVDQQDEIERLQDENARLRSCLSDDAENARQIMSENAELRERYDEYESKMDGLVLMLTGGLLSKSAATPNDTLYSVTMEQMTDELVGENFKLESENAKLRELAAWMYRLMDESCAVQHTYAPEPIRYDTLLDVHEKLRELGVLHAKE